MLDFLGLSSVDELIDQTVPDSIRIKEENAFTHRGKQIIGLDSESGVLRRMT